MGEGALSAKGARHYGGGNKKFKRNCTSQIPKIQILNDLYGVQICNNLIPKTVMVTVA